MPTSCPAPYTGTPPNCQPPAGSTTSPSGNSYPSTCPPPATGTPPNCQPPAGSTSTGGAPSSSPTSGGGNSQQYGSQPSGSGSTPIAPPTLTVNNPSSCIQSVLGSDAANRFQSGNFAPTPDQIAKAQSCFSAQVNYGPPPSGSQARSGQGSSGSNSSSGFQGGPNSQQAFANIAIAPPPAFQADSPMLTCAKSIVGDRFGSQPTPEQMAQIQSKCFAAATSGQQIGFIDPSGQNRGGPLPGVALASGGPNGQSGQPGSPPAMPPEIKACVLKAGMSETDINAIQRGQSPTAAQQAQGESCFSAYAKEKGYTPPTLTPPDPTQPFDPNSKQNQCADLVAQTHGIRFNQMNPGIVSSWSADDVGKLRSCYGVAPAGSASSNSVAFAPTSPQVAISSSKLTCMQTALGADKIAAVVAGTANISDADRKNVYDKCINPTKIAAGANPALLGVLAAMPPSELESQFIPVDSQTLPTPTASNVNQGSNGEVTVGGEVIVAAGATLPTKVDIFVKSTPQTYTVSLKKISATKATWTVNIAQNKLPLGNHKAYAVATLADATQLRSPEAKFAIAAFKAAKSRLPVVIEGTAVGLAVIVGGWAGWRWHNKKSLLPWRPQH
ncbi:hypothetical protein HYW35_01870 [Candidatus Saccharibacteria bacterium]|nr:hypothetical protein [Candidatus Saccharibacteria bacterium]